MKHYGFDGSDQYRYEDILMGFPQLIVGAIDTIAQQGAIGKYNRCC